MTSIADAWKQTAGDVAARIAQLRARTVPRPRRFAWADARELAQRLGWWAYIVSRARSTPRLPPATLEDVAILAAISAVEMERSQIIDPAHAEVWAALRQGLDALVAVGDLTPEIAAAILAMGTEQVAEFSHEECDYPALHAAGLITDVEAGLLPDGEA